MSMSPTISLTAAATQMGMVIGTAAYMAPEQAKGKVIDRRADIWAFGAVLFEMLTGERTFAGGDVSETLAQVIMKEVDWTALPADTPAALRQLLQRCLERDPRQRLRDIGEARIGIAQSGAVPASVVAEATSTLQLQVWQRPAPALIVVLLVAVMAGLAGWILTRPEPAGLVRFTIVPPDTAPFSSGVTRPGHSGPHRANSAPDAGSR